MLSFDREFVYSLLDAKTINILLESSKIQECLIKPNKKKNWLNKVDWTDNLQVLLDSLFEKSIPVEFLVCIRDDINKTPMKEKYEIKIDRLFRTFIINKIKCRWIMNNSVWLAKFEKPELLNFETLTHETILHVFADKSYLINHIMLWLEYIEFWEETNSYAKFEPVYYLLFQSVEKYMNQAIFWNRILFQKNKFENERSAE